jgi:hypothetical protein
VSLVKEWLKFVLSNRPYWKNGEIVKSGMVLDMISICYEKRRNGRHLADSDYRSCLWLYLCSYELYLPQLDNLTAKTKGGRYTLQNLMLALQHRLNPLHMYCRLLDMGLSKRLSGIICRYYEILMYGWLCWLSIRGNNILIRKKFKK